MIDYNLQWEVKGLETDMGFAAAIDTVCSKELKNIFVDDVQHSFLINVIMVASIPEAMQDGLNREVQVQVPYEGLISNIAYMYITYSSKNIEEDTLFGLHLAHTILTRNLYMSCTRPENDEHIYIYNQRAFSTRFFEAKDYPWYVDAAMKSTKCSAEVMLQ